MDNPWKSNFSSSEDLMREIQEEEEGTGTNSDYNSNTESLIQQQSMNVEKTTKRTRIAALLVVLVGAAASAGFFYLGISSAQKEEEDGFERAASNFAKSITVAWGDYESADLSIHESCRKWRTTNFTAEDFRVLYYYLKSGGLDFFAAEWTPNVTHAERPWVEEKSLEYYGDLEGLDYQGFTGLAPDPENPGSLVRGPSPNKSWYFPIVFVGPRTNFKSVGTYDGYTNPAVREAMDQAIHTWEPALTSPFRLVQHTEEMGLSVVLYHPGVPVPNATDITGPHDLASMVIYTPALMKRAANSQIQSLKVYLYDITRTVLDEDESPQYLSGLQIEVDDANIMNRNVLEISSTEYMEVKDSARMYFDHVFEVGGRTWMVVAVTLEGTFEAPLALVWVAGSLLFTASVLLALWMLHNMKRSIEIHQVITRAAAEASIVTNLFPADVRERILNDAEKKHQVQAKKAAKKKAFLNDGKKGKLLDDYISSEEIFGSRPIANLHPYTTVMFSDLVGFTSWSSTRDPSQVFMLLEIIYHSWDRIAARRRVYKVETVGDSYVAVAGLPEPRKDHAVVMARFANDCLKRMQRLLKALEKTLGPDTADLGCRFGLHSGQTVAGVLRGDKGRFQLFGDTVNMASRMESTGVSNHIQVSQETADVLEATGHSRWVVPRPELVNVKGKGLLQTYFLNVSFVSCGSQATILSNHESSEKLGTRKIDSGKRERLIEWAVEILSGLLRSIVARRMAMKNQVKYYHASGPESSDSNTVLDEVVEIITLPNFCASAYKMQVDPDEVILDAEILQQLTDLMTEFESMYQANSFHNFEHACHVTMSVVKMMGRIVDPNQVTAKAETGKDIGQTKLDASLHDHTFSITNDPLTQFACAFSSIIHDLDHQGVSNMVLVNERSPLAIKYKNKSVAEQNSVDLAWEMLLKPRYAKLCSCICCDEEEFSRFRQLVVNSVMATDIMDKELGAARKARWNKAFSTDENGCSNLASEETEQMIVNRKATIVIEHLIQASDIAHTMQHWHVYAKWNERLFHEMYTAYKTGRMDDDPSLWWYQGEIDFFDFYILPLAKKLFTCGVFGVSSDEFLNYACTNRKEWERKGEDMVRQYLKNYEEKCIERRIGDLQEQHFVDEDDRRMLEF